MFKNTTLCKNYQIYIMRGYMTNYLLNRVLKLISKKMNPLHQVQFTTPPALSSGNAKVVFKSITASEDAVTSIPSKADNSSTPPTPKVRERLRRWKKAENHKPPPSLNHLTSLILWTAFLVILFCLLHHRYLPLNFVNWSICMVLKP